MRREYWFQTRAPAARPAKKRFGYEKRRTPTRMGFTRFQRNWAFCFGVCWFGSDLTRWGYVSGKKKKTRMVPRPPRAVWSQKITRQERKVIITPCLWLVSNCFNCFDIGNRGNTYTDKWTQCGTD